MKKVIVALMFLLGFGFNAYALETGKPAPDFTLIDSNGQTHSLADHKGSYVVLEWFNPDCPFVVKHYDNSGNIPKLQKDYTSKGVVWLAINSSSAGKEGNYSPDEINAWAKKQGASATAYLLDSDGKVGKSYGAKTTPHMFIIDPKGNLIYQGAIDNKPTPNPDDIASSTNYVQQALGEAMDGKPVSVASTKSYGCSVKY
jgi:peroxiredoxin